MRIQDSRLNSRKDKQSRFFIVYKQFRGWGTSKAVSAFLKMFFLSSFIAAFAATSAIAFLSRRVGALTVSVYAPATTVTSVEDLKLVAEVTNTGAEDLNLVFKYGTILGDTRYTKSFFVIKDSETVIFQGIRVCSL